MRGVGGDKRRKEAKDDRVGKKEYREGGRKGWRKNERGKEAKEERQEDR